MTKEDYKQLIIDSHPAIINIDVGEDRIRMYTSILNLRGNNKMFYLTIDEENGAVTFDDFAQLSEALFLLDHIKWQEHFQLKDTINNYVERFEHVEAEWIGNGIRITATAASLEEYAETISELLAVHCVVDGLIGNDDATPL